MSFIKLCKQQKLRHSVIDLGLKKTQKDVDLHHKMGHYWIYLRNPHIKLIQPKSVSPADSSLSWFSPRFYFHTSGNCNSCKQPSIKSQIKIQQQLETWRHYWKTGRLNCVFNGTGNILQRVPLCAGPAVGCRTSPSSSLCLNISTCSRWPSCSGADGLTVHRIFVRDLSRSSSDLSRSASGLMVASGLRVSRRPQADSLTVMAELAGNNAAGDAALG